jgi:basic amino acid/polyamine antiporter, APA family
MAEITAESGGRPTVFLRNATGLVKAWSAYDAFIYSFMSVNLVTLGLYGMSFAYTIPDGQLLAAVVFTGIAVTFLVIVYAALIAAIPRAGGDYTWQSRILGGGIAFVLAMTGWWFILWHWTPIYANILVVQFISPLLATIGQTGAATWFATPNGIFVSCLITLAFVGAVVTAGMEMYARIQKACFYGGLVGLAVLILILLFSTQSDFHNAFNREAASLFGVQGDAYQATIDAAKKGGFAAQPFAFFAVGPSLLLVPWVVFNLLWPNWGATLYGEVRGAKEYWRPFYSMFAGLWVTVVLTAILLLVAAKTMGWEFYNSANAAYWNSVGGVQGAPAPVIPIWPYPVLLATWLIPNHAVQFILVAVMGLWFFGWAGTLFLSSTRVIFAAAFDRVLPSWAANISSNRRVPYGALLLMIVPSIVVSALYAYRPGFSTWTLDATLVIAVTYLGTIIAATILPWRRRDIFASSPVAQFKIAGVPVITIAGLLTSAFLIYNLVKWATDSVYGVNNQSSAIYMAAMYVLAIVIYVVARIVRGRQGIDLARIHAEIPVD